MLKTMVLSLMAFSALIAVGESTLARETNPPTVLVYRGHGSCTEGNCSKAASDIATRVGVTFRYVGPEEITPEIFEGVSAWIQPGGNAIELTQAISAEGMKAIRDFIARGGSYMGFCAGAFYADTWVDDNNTIHGLGIIPGETYDYMKDQSSKMIQVKWNGQMRDMYFQGGPAFRVSKSEAWPLAYYPNGDIAGILTNYGHGRVALSGVHPEAPDEWFKAEGLHDSDGLDLMYADQLLRWLLHM